MRALQIAVLPWLIWSSLGAQGSWPEVPSSVWNIKATDYPGGPGAIVLMDRWHFHQRSLERFRRVLVLGPSGRAKTELTLHGEKILKFEGRTLQKDGSSLLFTKGSDVVKATVLKVGREEIQVQRVFPPGVSDSSIVDVRWSEPIDAESRPVPEIYGESMVLSLTDTIPVQRAEVLFDLEVADFSWTRRIQIAPGQKHVQDKVGMTERHIFEDIPARPEVPYVSKADLKLPMVRWFYVPDLRPWVDEIGFRNQAISFPDAAACTIYYEHLSGKKGPKRSTLEEFRKMGTGLTSLPQKERAIALIRKLREIVKTVPELRDLPKDWGRDEDSLDQAFSRGWGTEYQLQMLGYYLLQELRCEPRLIMAIDREENRMHDSRDLFQYDKRVLGVQEAPGLIHYLNPGDAWNPVGLPPWLQGSQGFMIQPGPKRTDWKGFLINLPIEPPVNHLNRWSIKVTPTAEEDLFEVECLAKGGAATAWRRDVLQNARVKPESKIQEWLDRSGWRFSQIAVEAPFDPWSPMRFTAKGTREVEDGRKRLVFPFAFLHAPFSIPDAWPATMSQLIHLPAAQVIEAEARMPAPKTEQAAPFAPSERSNRIGKVEWRSERVESPSGAEWVLHLRIEVSAPVHAPERFQELKTFCGWVQEALRMGVDYTSGVSQK